MSVNKNTYPCSSKDWKAVSRSTPCEICGGTDYCEYTVTTNHCMRADSVGRTDGTPTNKRQGGHFFPRSEREWRVLPKPDAVSSYPKADAVTNNRVYESLMKLSPLSDYYLRDLTGPHHRLSPAQAHRYGWLPGDSTLHQQHVLAELERQHGRDTLLTVPGFSAKDDGTLTIRAGNCYLFPRRNTAGLIIAMDARRLTGSSRGGRYYCLSSHTDEHDGPSPGIVAHVATPAGGVRDTSRVGITEGAKKADVWADQSGCRVIGLPGVTTWAAAAVVPLIEELDPDVVMIGFDRDDPTKKGGAVVATVSRAQQDLAEAISRRGRTVRVAEWDYSKGKGIDDVLLTGHDVELHRYIPATSEQDDYHPQLLHDLIEVLHNKSIPANYRLIYMKYLVQVMMSKQERTGDGESRVWLLKWAEDLGVGKNVPGTAMDLLALNGYLTIRRLRLRSTDEETGELGTTTHTLVAPGRRLSRRDVVRPSKKQEGEADRSRRRRAASGVENDGQARVAGQGGLPATGPAIYLITEEKLSSAPSRPLPPPPPLSVTRTIAVPVAGSPLLDEHGQDPKAEFAQWCRGVSSPPSPVDQRDAEVLGNDYQDGHISAPSPQGLPEPASVTDLPPEASKTGSDDGSAWTLPEPVRLAAQDDGSAQQDMPEPTPSRQEGLEPTTATATDTSTHQRRSDTACQECGHRAALMDRQGRYSCTACSDNRKRQQEGGAHVAGRSTGQAWGGYGVAVV